MPEQPTNAARSLIDRFLDSLRKLPDVNVHLNVAEPILERAAGIDAQVGIDVAGRSLMLLIEAKKAAYPRDVRQALWQCKALGQDQYPNAQYVLVAESLSPGAKELLRAGRIGYYDSGGSLFLPVSGAYVFIEKPPPKSLERSVRSLFSGRRAQVLHALLLDHESWFGVTAMAERAGVAPSTVSQILGELERFDWLDSRGQGPSKERHLREPGALLDAWAAQLVTLRAPTLHRYYVSGLKPDALMKRLGQVLDAHQVGYAVSYEAAAQIYAPLVSGISQVRVRLLPSAAADAAMAELGASVVSEGTNLAVVEAESMGELLFRQQIEGVWLASPIQVYLDLLRSEGRAKEMATHLRGQRIGF